MPGELVKRKDRYEYLNYGYADSPVEIKDPGIKDSIYLEKICGTGQGAAFVQIDSEKVKAIEVVNCKKLQILFNTCISTLTIIRSSGVTVQCTGSCKFFDLQKSTDCQIIVPDPDVTFNSSESANCNITYFDEDEEPHEHAIPFQTETRYQEKKDEFLTVVVDSEGHAQWPEEAKATDEKKEAPAAEAPKEAPKKEPKKEAAAPKKVEKKCEKKSSSGVNMNGKTQEEHDKNIKKKFKRVKQRKSRYVIYKIVDHISAQLDHSGKRDGTNFLTFTERLPESECRYAVYDHEYKTNDNRITSKVYFIAWVPKNANQEDRIVYSEKLSEFRGGFEGCLHLSMMTPDDVKTQFANEWIEDEGYTVPQDEEEDEDSEPDFD